MTDAEELRLLRKILDESPGLMEMHSLLRGLQYHVGFDVYVNLHADEDQFVFNFQWQAGRERKHLHIAVTLTLLRMARDVSFVQTFITDQYDKHRKEEK